MRADHFERNGIVATAGNNDVGMLFVWLNEGLVHGLNGGEILIDNGGKRARSLLSVAPYAAENALVCIGVHEDLEIEPFSDSLIGENEDPLQKNDTRGNDVLAFLRAAMHGVIIDRNVDLLALGEQIEMAA